MSSKIEINVGNFKFVGEGEPKWLAEQLDKILKQSNQLVKLAPVSDSIGEKHDRDIQTQNKSHTSLSKFLKDHNATVNQNSKFLGAAVFLSTVKGKTHLKTADISTALREAGQTKLNNASLNLSQNLKQGSVEKVSSNEFMVTVEGKEKFGINE